MSIRYVPPTAQDLHALKNKLGYTSKQMADLFGLANDNQWRKYTTGKDLRPMSLPMLFLAGAVLHPHAHVADIFDWCREVGATVTLPEGAGGQQP